ncbi:MAG TPA: hypothetical protein VF228_25915 [Iamia sp.]
MTPPTAETPPEPWSHVRRRIYRQLLEEGLDADDLDRLLDQEGAALLDRSVPYLVVAARNRARSAARRDRRRAELEDAAERDPSLARPSPLDPAELVAARAELDDVVEQLGGLDPRYSWPLWWHAAGYEDDEIIDLWDEAGFEPPHPTRATIRKRRERARSMLRRPG